MPVIERDITRRKLAGLALVIKRILTTGMETHVTILQATSKWCRGRGTGVKNNADT